MKKTRKSSFLIFGIFILVFCSITGLFFVPKSTKKSLDIPVYEYSSLSKHTPNEYGGLVSFPENGSFTGRTEDRVISLKWDVPAKKALLTIVDKDGKSQTKTVKGTGKYAFKTGVHGDTYIFRLQYIDNNGQGTTKEIKRKFLESKKLPALMILRIDTEDGRGPVYEKVSKPSDGLFGMGVINKQYKKAVLNGNMPVKIRIRGNFSAVHAKKSYKLSFPEKVDLLGLGEEYSDKEWVLLGRSHIQTYFGFELSKVVGIEWEPRMRFVNLMLNGDWKGLYILCESVKRHPKRLAIEENGFLIESDGYYWSNNGAYFKSALLADEVGFTFKYPKINTKQEPRFLEIQNEIMNLDTAVRRKSKKIRQLIDLDNFVTWELAHEFMGTDDGYGSNMFFYKQNADPKTKLKMGPLWDFDSVFLMKNNQHSAFWSFTSTYFPFLLKNSFFRKYYKKKYFDIAPNLEKQMKSILEDMKNIPGLEESWRLSDRNDKIERNYRTVDDEIDDLMWNLHERIEWLNQEIKKL